MASIIQHKEKWRALVSIAGVRKSRVFELKSEAKRWAKKVEQDASAGKYSTGNHTLHDAFKKYRDEVSITKKGGRWEVVRLNKFIRDIADTTIDHALTPKLAEWRDSRLKEVSSGSVRREINLVASVLEQARREWKWCDINPARDVRKPPSPPARRRGVSQAEIDAMCKELGYSDELAVTLKFQEVAVAFLLAIETGMRAGEILAATYDLDRRVASLLDSKNGDERLVPLSQRAIFLKGKISKWTIHSASLDYLFRAAREKTDIVNLHFHDSRSEAITRLSKKLDIHQLARMVGHRDLKSLLIYYSESAEDIAKRL